MLSGINKATVEKPGAYTGCNFGCNTGRNIWLAKARAEIF